MIPRQEIKEIAIKDLHLWTENPRDPIESDLSNESIIRRAIEDGDGKWNLPKMLKDMGEYYDTSELPTVVELDGRFVVYDGNRRLATIHYVQNRDLYAELGGGMFPELESDKLRSLEVIPCNVCDLDTALTNIERKHINSGTWGHLERDYFAYTHRGRPKSLFMMLDEQTGGYIGSNKSLNKGFVRDELLTKRNLQDLGFVVDDGRIKCPYSNDEAASLLEKIKGLIENDIVSTRNSRGKLKEALLHEYPDTNIKDNELDGNLKNLDITLDTELTSKPRPARRTRAERQPQVIFGKKRILKQGQVNRTYAAIEDIYKKLGQKDHVLPIIGMSLRLLLDVAARTYYIDKDDPKKDRDMVYKTFLKQAKRDMDLPKSNENYLAVTNSWLNGNQEMEALFGKYAHGNIKTAESDILAMSELVGDIVEFYYRASRDVK